VLLGLMWDRVFEFAGDPHRVMRPQAISLKQLRVGTADWARTSAKAQTDMYQRRPFILLGTSTMPVLIAKAAVISIAC
jgi:hypothetical protein